MRNAQSQPVHLPEIPDRAAVSDTTAIYGKLYAIEPVTIRLVFAAPDDQAEVQLVNPNSARLFELLHKANMERATVIELTVRGKPIKPAALARINWFLHIDGYTRGFRGWKRAREVNGGVTLWKSGPAWDDFKALLQF